MLQFKNYKGERFALANLKKYIRKINKNIERPLAGRRMLWKYLNCW